MCLVFNLVVVILFIIDIVTHGLVTFSVGLLPAPNSISKAILLYLVVIYVVLYVKNIKKISLSPIAFFPVLCFNREILELKTYTYTISFFDIYLFLTIFYIGLVSLLHDFPRKKVTGRMIYAVLFLLLIGAMQVVYHNRPENTNGFFITYFYPLIYFLILSRINFNIADVRHSLFTMFLVSIFIFILQNIYIGPLVVYRSSVEQTWLTQNISIANGGLLEIGAMEAFLMPMAFYIIWNISEIKKIYNKNYTKTLIACAIFVIIMPYIYHNRANSLVVLSFVIFYLVKKLSMRKVILYFSSIVPLLGIGLYRIIVSRSFVSDGKEINILGFTISSIDSTTYNHLESTILGVEALTQNLFFGVGLLTGEKSMLGSEFHIGNMRNFIFPVIEVAISMGVIFFVSYTLLVIFFYRSTQDSLMKYLLLLQYIPVIGASKFFFAYATGTFPVDSGFYGLSDFSPIAITSISSIYVYLLCVIHTGNARVTNNP